MSLFNVRKCCFTFLEFLWRPHQEEHSTKISYRDIQLLMSYIQDIYRPKKIRKFKRIGRSRAIEQTLMSHVRWKSGLLSVITGQYCPTKFSWQVSNGNPQGASGSPPTSWGLTPRWLKSCWAKMTKAYNEDSFTLQSSGSIIVSTSDHLRDEPKV